MPNFKKEGRGFKMKGFTAFTKADTPMRKPLVGDQNKLPENLKQKILDAPMKMYDKSSMKMYDKSAMKKYGKSPMKKDDDKSKKQKSTNKTDDRVFGVNQEKYDNWNKTKNRGKGPDVRYLGSKENKKHLDSYLDFKKSKNYKKYSDLEKHDDDRG
tara:strand:- start:332 stop:799 length:468 start_codon:yes stop_codon:yes gene_type:complete